MITYFLITLLRKHFKNNPIQAIRIRNFLKTAAKVLFPFLLIYGVLSNFVPFFGLILFFALFFLVVRNEKLSHFLRFNTMQSLLLSIFTTLCQLVLQLLGLVIPTVGSEPLLVTVLFNLIFLAIVSSAVYSIFQCLRGMYAEIPVISEAAYAQVR